MFFLDAVITLLLLTHARHVDNIVYAIDSRKALSGDSKPGDRMLIYQYEPANGRLLPISDALGNRIAHACDAPGSVILQLVGLQSTLVEVLQTPPKMSSRPAGEILDELMMHKDFFLWLK